MRRWPLTLHKGLHSARADGIVVGVGSAEAGAGGRGGIEELGAARRGRGPGGLSLKCTGPPLGGGA